MKTLTLFLIVAFIAFSFIAFSFWYAKRSKAIAKYQHKPKNILTEQDEPIEFGYKIAWIAVKTDNKLKLSKILGIKDLRPSNWESGIENAYGRGVYGRRMHRKDPLRKCVFITPQIGEWTLAVGLGLLFSDTQESIVKLENVLNELSSEFGEAQFFGTHRVSDYHSWMKSVNGKMERVYSFVGSEMETIKVYGNPTEAEKGLSLFNSLSEEAESDEYFEREDIDYADEELVMKIAQNWSVNPAIFAARDDIKDELGILGK